ncbi:hypothetical protein [uncultured Dialister sp.]|uniref:hypothetical protein n=1 Tax=uncultured Dialister sp. TaxID=278064 RepID=UPI0025D6F939|nr:hypothetical protein [uncultured Dialister sp.]
MRYSYGLPVRLVEQRHRNGKLWGIRMAFRYDWWGRGIGMESFEVFVWPSGTTGGEEA